jgi:hypothetical protein
MNSGGMNGSRSLRIYGVIKYSWAISRISTKQQSPWNLVFAVLFVTNSIFSVKLKSCFILLVEHVWEHNAKS